LDFLDDLDLDVGANDNDGAIDGGSLGSGDGESETDGASDSFFPFFPPFLPFPSSLGASSRRNPVPRTARSVASTDETATRAIVMTTNKSFANEIFIILCGRFGVVFLACFLS